MIHARHPVTARVLQWGVGASFLLLVAGLLFAARSEEAIDFHRLLRDVRSVGTGHADGLIHLGIVILLLTPFLRVLTLLLDFHRSKELPFVLISLGVLLLLLVSSALGFR